MAKSVPLSLTDQQTPNVSTKLSPTANVCPKIISVVQPPTLGSQQDNISNTTGQLFSDSQYSQLSTLYTVPTNTTFVIGNGVVPTTSQQNPNVSTKVPPTVTPTNAAVNVWLSRLQHDLTVKFSGQVLLAIQAVHPVYVVLKLLIPVIFNVVTYSTDQQFPSTSENELPTATLLFAIIS